MKILSRRQIADMEMQAEKDGTNLSALMNSAGAAVADKVKDFSAQRIVILCGKGNNGGDGFVCARLLSAIHKNITVILAAGKPATEIAEKAFNEIPAEVKITDIENTEGCRAALSAADLIIEAVFGFSFHGVIDGKLAELICDANKAQAIKVSVDLPGGVSCDDAYVSGIAFRADYTYTFHALKPANVSYPAREYCGKTTVCDIGLSYLLPENAAMLSVDSEFIKSTLPIFEDTANKGNLGKLLLICGSYGMAGACILAAKAALRSGIGLLYILIDSRIYPIVAANVPEAVYIPVDFGGDTAGLKAAVSQALSSCTACAVGCGLGENSEALCGTVFSRCRVPLLIDADGINYLSRHPQELPSCDILLTPHPGELSRLTGQEIQAIQSSRINSALSAAKKINGTLLLKGAGTIIADQNGRTAVNNTGNSGMATGGSGDTLSGIIGTLMAQGIDVFSAAAAGAYIHGTAGDLCAEALSRRSMLPSDLIERLPEVFKKYQ